MATRESNWQTVVQDEMSRRFNKVTNKFKIRPDETGEEFYNRPEIKPSRDAFDRAYSSRGNQASAIQGYGAGGIVSARELRNAKPQTDTSIKTEMQAQQAYQRGEISGEEFRAWSGGTASNEQMGRSLRDVQANARAYEFQVEQEREQERLREQGFADFERKQGIMSDVRLREEDQRAANLSEREIEKYNKSLEAIDQARASGNYEPEVIDEYLTQLELFRLGAGNMPKPLKQKGAMEEPEIGSQSRFGEYVGKGLYERPDGSLLNPETGKVIPAGRAEEEKSKPVEFAPLVDMDRKEVASQLEQIKRLKLSSPEDYAQRYGNATPEQALQQQVLEIEKYQAQQLIRQGKPVPVFSKAHAEELGLPPGTRVLRPDGQEDVVGGPVGVGVR